MTTAAPHARSFPMVGRGTELAELLACAERGTGAVIVGPTGIGKSRLLAEVVAARSGYTASIAASESARTIPLGAFLSVIPHDDVDVLSGTAHDVLGIASRVRRVHGGPGRALVVDDAHLLDSASAGLVMELARAGTAVFATVRSGERSPDAVTALWRNGLAERLELGPLSPGESHALVESLLGGPVDPRLARSVFDLTEGIPLYLRETVGVLRSQLRHRDGVWMLAGAMPRLRGLGALAEVVLERVPPSTRVVLDLLALAGGLPVTHARALASPEQLESAETLGLLAVEIDASGDRVVLGHPLYRDMLLERMPVLRRHRLVRTLVDRAVQSGPRDGDLARICLWKMEIGDVVSVDTLLEAIEQGQTADAPDVDALLAVAAPLSMSATDRLRLAAAHAHRHRAEEAERVLATIDTRSLEPATRTTVLLTRAYLQVMPLHQPALALHALDEALRRDGDQPAVLAHRATALWKLGRLEEACATAKRVVDDPAAEAADRTHAGLTLASTLVHRAQVDRAGRALAERAIPTAEIARAAHSSLPEAADALGMVGVAVHLVDEDLDQLERGAREGWNLALARGDDGIRAQYGVLWGWSEALRGRLGSAIELLREHRRIDGTWRETMRAFAGGYLVRVLCEAGQVDRAERVLELLDGVPVAPLYAPQLTLARAAVLAANGSVEEAARMAIAAGDAAAIQGHGLVWRDAWYDAVRWGSDDAARRLRSHRAELGSTAGRLRVAHALAWLDRDGPRVGEIARRLTDAGLLLWAVDAQEQSVTLLGADGGTATSLLAELRRRVPDASSPAVRAERASVLSALTARELEIARLAWGMTDRQVADELGISVRTVTTHLARSYAKLGIRGRSQLRELL